MDENTNQILKALPSMLHNGLDNYIVPGLRSYLVGDGTAKKGKVRMFTATREASDFITPHSHRFSLAILVLTGRVENTLFEKKPNIGYDDADQWVESSITQVCGPTGILEFKHHRSDEPTRWRRLTYSYSAGEAFHMSAEAVHSIVYHKGASALLFEGPEITTVSTMLEPFVNGKLVPTFKTEDWMFEKLA